MNTIEKIEDLTGLKRGEMDKIWQEVKANSAKLESCSLPHEFSVEYRRTGKLVRDWECSKCHGHVDIHAKKWYMQGIKDSTKGTP